MPRRTGQRRHHNEPRQVLRMLSGRKVQASVARCLRTPPYAAKRKGLSFGLGHCLRSDGHRSTVVIGNCTNRTDNGGTPPRQS